MLRFLIVVVATTLAGACSDDGATVSDAVVVDLVADLSSADLAPADSAPDSGPLADLPVADGAADTGPDAPAAGPAAPLFASSASYAITVSGSNDPADVYYPTPPDLATGGYAFPVVLLLQGAKVDKQHYSKVAGLIARYGFVVVVPNHQSLMGMFMELSVIPAVLAQMKTEAASATSPVAGAVDTGKLGLVGHSYGGVVGLYAIQEICQIPFCFGAFKRPAELMGGAFYGTNMKPPIGPIPKIDNHGIATALIQGDLDGKSLLADAQTTYNNIQQPPRALVTVAGANHYGICDINNPSGADADPKAPTLAQGVANETVARWAAMYLRAHLLGEAAALDYVYQSGDALDPNVTVAGVK